MGEHSEILQLPSGLGSLTLKPAAFKDLYLPPVVSEASTGGILNTNHLHILKQLLNIDQEKKNSTKKIPRATEEILNYYPS